MMSRGTFIFLAVVAAFVLVHGDEERLLGTKSRGNRLLGKHMHWHKHHAYSNGSKRSSLDKNLVLFIKVPSYSKFIPKLLL